jgi:hypothetical protein
MSQDIHSPQVGATSVMERPVESRRRRTSSSHHGRRRRGEPVSFGRRGDAHRGRILVIVMFVVERLYEAAMGIGLPGGPDKKQLIAGSIVAALWCAALTVGVLRRMNWCRYILIAVEFCGAAIALGYLILILPTGLSQTAKTTTAILYGAFVLIHGGFGWVLMRSGDVRRLTSRAHD